MSGRVRHTLADGRTVRGYRKTLKQRAARTPPHLLPDWHLSFFLPENDMRFLGVTEGPYASLIHVIITRIGHSTRVEASGKDRNWVLGLALNFMLTIAPSFTGDIAAVLG